METIIDLNEINQQFYSNHALKNISLKLKSGRIGLLGPNGAGKSTLLKILLGLISPTSGEGKVLSESIQSSKVKQRSFFGWGRNNFTLRGTQRGNERLRKKIGYMPEADALIPGLTGIEYVALAGELYGMPRAQAQRRAHEVLTYLELEDARYRRLEQYSTGMKQRIKLAQALIHDPPLLLLDEPTSGLDPAGRDAMLRLLLELGRDFGKSLILSTHLLADVEVVCEQIVILLNGSIRFQGNVDSIRSQQHDRYRLRIQGDNRDFCKDLQLEGIEILSENNRGELRVQVPKEWQTRNFFVLADHHQVILRGLEPDQETLEELFLRMVIVNSPTQVELATK